MKAVSKMSCVAALCMGVLLSAQADGLVKVQQTIFGMDCAPCAYGVHQRLMKLSGVTQVDVSLNDGVAAIVFGPDSPTTLAQIYGVLVDGGFTPKQAEITVEGHIAKQGGQLNLVTQAGGQYQLVLATADAQAWQADVKVVVQGQIADPGAGGVPVLQVQKIVAVDADAASH